MDVALFIPCYVDQLYPQVGLATATLLERLGCTVHFPEAQTCCGQPMANSGFFDDARPLAQRMAEVFAGFDHVVCPSGSCTSMVRNHYDALLGDSPRLQALQTATRELCEFVLDVLRIAPKGKFEGRVALHQSCHGLRELRLASGSERLVPQASKLRAVLENIEGLELVTPLRSDECCGFGGTFAVAEEAVSCAMGRDRNRDLAATGASIVTGGDVSCLMHLQGLASRDKSPLRYLHIAELLEEATR